MIDPKTFAASTLQLLQDDPRRYRLFGAYWYLVKAVLKKFYTSDNLHLLGDHVDRDAVERMPQHTDLQSALAAAVENIAKMPASTWAAPRWRTWPVAARSGWWTRTPGGCRGRDLILGGCCQKTALFCS